MIVGAHRLEMIVRLVSALDAIVPMVVLNRLDKRVVGTKLSHTSFCVGSIAVRNLISRGKGCIWISATHRHRSLFSEGLSHLLPRLVFHRSRPQQRIIYRLILLWRLQFIAHYEVCWNLVQPSLSWIQSGLWPGNFPSIRRGKVICREVHGRVLSHCEVSGPEGITGLLTFGFGDETTTLRLTLSDCRSQVYVCHCSLFEE